MLRAPSAARSTPIPNPSNATAQPKAVSWSPHSLSPPPRPIAVFLFGLVVPGRAPATQATHRAGAALWRPSSTGDLFHAPCELTAEANPSLRLPRGPLFFSLSLFSLSLFSLFPSFSFFPLAGVALSERMTQLESSLDSRLGRIEAALFKLSNDHVASPTTGQGDAIFSWDEQLTGGSVKVSGCAAPVGWGEARRTCGLGWGKARRGRRSRGSGGGCTVPFLQRWAS